MLIGMAGVGKSTVGVLLAKALSRDFVDTDLVVQSAEGMGLQSLVDALGSAGFLAVEERHVLGLTVTGSVIATGGSVVYSDAAMQHLKHNATTVYLRLPLAQLEARVSSAEARGLAMGAGQSFADLYAERLPLYERYADMTVDCEGLNHDEAVNAIVARIG